MNRWCRRLTAVGLAALTLAAPAYAVRHFYARRPLPRLLFSIDGSSPTAQSPQPGIRPGDVLQYPGPTIVFSRANLGLMSPNDHIDGLSFARIGYSLNQTFVIRFSVDRSPFGGLPPNPDMVAAGFPFNATQQGQLNQAAGDEFITLRLFRRTGPVTPSEVGVFAANNVLAVGQGDAGGTDYGLKPEIGPDVDNSGAPLDDLKAGASPGGQPTLDAEADEYFDFELGGPGPLFFSLRSNSPSLPTLPSPASGATIYVDFTPNAPGGVPVYATPLQLGLVPGDDVEDFVVFDDGDFVYNRLTDQILFTLNPSSPSLTGTGTVFQAGDILTTRTTGPRLFDLFIPVQSLGLNPNANIDLLEIANCNDLAACIFDWAIGNEQISGDMNCDGVVTVGDISGFVLALTDPAAYAGAYPDCNRFIADIDGDYQVTVSDIAGFVALLGN
jgi:hypothetical protein